MEHDLYSLAYLSQNAVAWGEEQLQDEIRSILGSARRTNRQMGVTGALLYTDGYFAQVLEGPLHSVEEVFERIQCDPRHSEIKLLHLKPIACRSFPAWSMAFAGLPGQTTDTARVDEVLARPEDIESGRAGQDLLTLLRDLMARYESADV